MGRIQEQWGNNGMGAVSPSSTRSSSSTASTTASTTTTPTLEDIFNYSTDRDRQAVAATSEQDALVRNETKGGGNICRMETTAGYEAKAQTTTTTLMVAQSEQGGGAATGIQPQPGGGGGNKERPGTYDDDDDDDKDDLVLLKIIEARATAAPAAAGMRSDDENDQIQSKSKSESESQRHSRGQDEVHVRERKRKSQKSQEDENDLEIMAITKGRIAKVSNKGNVAEFPLQKGDEESGQGGNKQRSAVVPVQAAPSSDQETMAPGGTSNDSIVLYVPMDQPGAYCHTPGQIDLQRNESFRPDQFLTHSTRHTTSSTTTDADGGYYTTTSDEESISIQSEEPPPPPDARTSDQQGQEEPTPDLVQATAVSQEDPLDMVAGEATAVDTEAIALAEKTRQLKKEERRFVLFTLLAIAATAIGIFLCILLVLFLQQDDAEGSETEKLGATATTTMTEAPQEGARFNNNKNTIIDLGDIPDYTQASLLDPFSPQSEAYHWLSQHRNLTGLPQWRQRQLFALACMYYSFGGTNWPLGLDKDWLDDTRSECDWYSGLYGFFSVEDGVTYGEHNTSTESYNCDTQGRIHTIRMAEGAKFGFSLSNPSFPPEISWLTSLKYLGMANDGLYNWSSSPELFPQQFYQLRNLEHLSLGMNPARSTIPTQLGLLTKLTRLGLWDMEAIGTIPTQLGLLTNMRLLDLHRNQLTGTIPTQLFSLGRIVLSENNLEGNIPSQFGLLDNIFGLKLRDNPSLSGTLPSQLGLLTGLDRYFEIQNTNITGTIPEAFCHLGEDTCISVSRTTGKEYSCSLQFDCSSASQQLCGCDCECWP